MEDQNKFHYEIKAPDRVFWHFRGFLLDGKWYVEVSHEPNEDGICFEMETLMDAVPSLIDVFSAFQAKVAALLNPIAWEIHHHRNTGME